MTFMERTKGSNVVIAEVAYDGQHGPVVRLTVDGISVAVYLADETGILTTPEGQAGIEVSGAWHAFRQGVRVLVEDNKWAMIG